MLEKYEHYIETHFEPYAAMHECRQHSNLWGKMVSYGDKALETDNIGFYKPVPVFGVASENNYHEEYPLMAGAWVYDHQYLDAKFNYNDLEKDYLKDSQIAEASDAKTQLKQKSKVLLFL